MIVEVSSIALFAIMCLAPVFAAVGYVVGRRNGRQEGRYDREQELLKEFSERPILPTAELARTVITSRPNSIAAYDHTGVSKAIVRAPRVRRRSFREE